MGTPFFLQITSSGRSPSATVQITLKRLPCVKLAGKINFSTNGATFKIVVGHCRCIKRCVVIVSETEDVFSAFGAA